MQLDNHNEKYFSKQEFEDGDRNVKIKISLIENYFNKLFKAWPIHIESFINSLSNILSELLNICSWGRPRSFFL